MTAHLNPPRERRKTRLNEAASNTQIPEGVAPGGAAGAQRQRGGRGRMVGGSRWVVEWLSGDRSGGFGGALP